jgi:hypothetical protein
MNASSYAGAGQDEFEQIVQWLRDGNTPTSLCRLDMRGESLISGEAEHRPTVSSETGFVQSEGGMLVCGVSNNEEAIH